MNTLLALQPSLTLTLAGGEMVEIWNRVHKKCDKK